MPILIPDITRYGMMFVSPMDLDVYCSVLAHKGQGNDRSIIKQYLLSKGLASSSLYSLLTWIVIDVPSKVLTDYAMSILLETVIQKGNIILINRMKYKSLTIKDGIAYFITNLIRRDIKRQTLADYVIKEWHLFEKKFIKVNDKEEELCYDNPSDNLKDNPLYLDPLELNLHHPDDEDFATFCTSYIKQHSI